MGSKKRHGEDQAEALLRELAREGSFEEELGDAILSLQSEVELPPLSVDLEERIVEAAQRGAFDGRVARARVRLQGSLGGFGSALRRIREAAGVSPTRMAERAGIEPELWEALETQRCTPDALDVSALASVAEAAQLRVSEIEDTIRRSQRLHLLPGGQASFRAEEDASSDSMAAYEDLVAAAEDERSDPDADLSELVEALGNELRRRGREDLL